MNSYRDDRPPDGPPPDRPPPAPAMRKEALRDIVAELVRAEVEQIIAAMQPPRVPQSFTMPTSVVKALIGVMARIPDLAKSGTNKADKYDYVTVGDVYKSVQHALVEEGLVINQRQVAPIQIINKVIVVRCEFDAMHISGEGITNIGSNTGACRFEFKSGTVDDKALNKAFSSGYKQFLLSYFKIAPDDATMSAIEPESDARGLDEDPPDLDKDRRDERRDERRDDRRDERRDDRRDERRDDRRDERRDDRPPPRRDDGPPARRDDGPPPGPPDDGPPPDRWGGDGESRAGRDERPGRPAGETDFRKAGETDFRKEVMAFKTKLENCQSVVDANLLWQDNAPLLRRVIDTTYEYLRSIYIGMWNESPSPANP